jgi:dTMP kinase
LPVEEVRAVGQIATGGVSPDVVFLLDMPAEAALARIGRDHDRMEAQGLAYLTKVVEGYRAEAASSSATVRIIDAAQSVEDVQDAIRRAAKEFLSGD